MPETDPRESRLASLVRERATIRKQQQESVKMMRETLAEMDREIQTLAAEIESGQQELGL